MFARRLAGCALLAIGIGTGTIACAQQALQGADSTRAYLALNWTFGSAGQGTEAALGVLTAHTTSGGDVTGAKASLAFKVQRGLTFSRAKLTGLIGTPELQGELGVGYSAATGLIGTGGVNAPNLQAGADFGLGSGVEGYLGLTTLGKLREPTRAP